MTNLRMSKRVLLAAGAFTAVGAVGIATLFASGASAEPTPFVVNGSQIANDQFSFSTLQPAEVHTLVETARNGLTDKCMSSKGFATPPVDNPTKAADVKYATGYAAAIIGDDATSDDSFRPVGVKLPDGSTYEIETTWTPDTCAYQAYASLGGDPFLREALKQQIMIYQAQAGKSLNEQLSGATAEWAKCVGGDGLVPADLLRAVDGGRLRTDLDPSKSKSCLSDDLIKKAAAGRSDAELRFADDHRENVDAWIRILEMERAAVSGV